MFDFCFSFSASTLEDISCVVSDLRKQKIELNIKINDKIENVTANESITMTYEQLALLLAGNFDFRFFPKLLVASAPKIQSVFNFVPDLKSAREQMKNLPS